MHTLGKHFLLDLRSCNKKVLDDLDFLRDIFLSLAKLTNASLIGESFHRFDPQGISGMILIKGSHLCIHTWPEYGYAAIDIYTYGDSFQPEVVANLLIEKLESRNPSIVELKRGFLP